MARGATVLTDEWPGYKRLNKKFFHYSVNHSEGVYARGRVHTNSIEGFWSLLKRQIYGIHHWVSKKHLAKYVSEATWRYNRRSIEDAPRLNEFISRLDGRLTYAGLIA